MRPSQLLSSATVLVVLLAVIIPVVNSTTSASSSTEPAAKPAAPRLSAPPSTPVTAPAVAKGTPQPNAPASPSSVAVAASMPERQRLAAAMNSVLAERDGRLQELRDALRTAPDMETTITLQRQVQAVKHEAEIGMLRVQAESARERGDVATEALVRETMAAIERSWNDAHVSQGSGR